MRVDEAILSRKTTRQFLPDPVPEQTLREILEVARYAPSGSNLQPWRVIVVTGAARDAVAELGRQAVAEKAPSEEGDYPMHPHELFEPYLSRRAQVASERFEQLGIPREDRAARRAQMARNAEFYGAPAAMFFVADKRLPHAQWVDMGSLMVSIALTAYERGVATCYQLWWAMYRDRLHAHFGLAEHDVIHCGMAFGYADQNAPINAYRSKRAAVDEFVTFKS
jgi:nitroreductase